LKTTSIKVDEDMWKRLKILSIELGVPMSELLKDSIEALVEAGESMKEPAAEEQVLAVMRRLRSEGRLPFTIEDRRTSVEIVREGRGR
jgi:predicted DNA-binding protein